MCKLNNQPQFWRCAAWIRSSCYRKRWSRLNGDSLPIGFGWPKMSSDSKKNSSCLCSTSMCRTNSRQSSDCWQAWCPNSLNRQRLCRHPGDRSPSGFGLLKLSRYWRTAPSSPYSRHRNTQRSLSLFPWSSDESLDRCIRSQQHSSHLIGDMRA